VALTAVRTNGSAVQYVAGCLAEEMLQGVEGLRNGENHGKKWWVNGF
jgi:predicted amino acid dehydrogenase